MRRHLFTFSSFVALALGAASPARAADHQLGIATAVDSGRLLYHEHHWRYVEGGTARRLVLYRCPDGTPFARKRLDEGAGASTPEFDFTDGRDGATEAVARAGGGRRVHVREGTRDDRVDVAERGDGVIDAGFDAFVRAHWTQLADGRSLVVPFLIPARAAWWDFRVRHVRDGSDAGVRVRRIRIALAAWYAFAAPSIDLTYGLDDRRLRRFVGPGYVRDRQGAHPRVRIDFPAAPAAEGADAAAIAAALRAPLTGRCPG
jgi:hypothetical protein